MIAQKLQIGDTSTARVLIHASIILFTGITAITTVVVGFVA